MAASYDLMQSGSGQYYFTLQADNNEVVLTSEQYTEKESALNGIESVRGNSANEEMYEVRESASGQPYFVLKAENHQVIGTSEMYSSQEACKGGMEVVMEHGPSAPLQDKT